MRKLNGVPKRHFNLVLKECEWRFNGGSPRQLSRQLRKWIKIANHRVLSRALSDQMEPFDRDDFAPWLGACSMAMWGIGKDRQRRHGAQEPGLLWGKSAPRVPQGVMGDARPQPRIALRAAPARKTDLPPSN